jgi:hypothetical protein
LKSWQQHKAIHEGLHLSRAAVKTTGFLVSKRIKHQIIDLKSITPRICTLRMRALFFNYSTANGHAPTETTYDEEKDWFFDFLETAYDISPRNHIKIALGNFSAQVGKEAVNFPTDKYSLHQACQTCGPLQAHLRPAQRIL